MAERKKCADLIEANLRDRMNDLRAVLRKENRDTREEWDEELEDYVEVNDYPDDTPSMSEYLENMLYLDARIEVKIELSQGGPADGFIIHLDPQGEVEEGHYYYVDWHDYAEMKLQSDELDDLMAMYGGYLECYRLEGC